MYGKLPRTAVTRESIAQSKSCLRANIWLTKGVVMSSDAENRANMVLRTVYLPREVDGELRRLAFDWRRSKGEIIRECVRIALGVHRIEMFQSSQEHKAQLEAALEAALKAPPQAPRSEAQSEGVAAGVGVGAVRNT